MEKQYLLKEAAPEASKRQFCRRNASEVRIHRLLPA